MDTFQKYPSVIKSQLTPEQINVLNIYQSCGFNVDSKLFLNIWKLVEFGVEPSLIVAFINDVIKYHKK